MMPNPNVVFSADPRHGLVAHSDRKQQEARTVLRDLGWEWAEELHALVPPNNVPGLDAGVRAVEELHLHGHRTGYTVGPYGTMRLPLDRAEQVLTKLAERDTPEARPQKNPQAENQAASRQRSTCNRSTIPVVAAPAETPESPAI